MAKAIKVEVTLFINDEADASEVVEDCDYSFNHPEIVDHEITALFNEHDQTVFSL
jgi:hypothetical protein